MSDENSAIKKLQSEFFSIENRSDITDDEKVTQIIKITSVVCAGLAIQPIPFADIFILTPIQGLMGSRIAAVRGIPISKNDSVETIKQILGTIGLGLGAQQLVIGAYKTFIPFAGGLFTIPLVFGLTYGIGRVMDQYLINKSKGRTLDRDELRRIFNQGKKEGKKEGKDHKKNKEEFKSPNEPITDSIKFVKTNFDDIIIVTSLQLIRDGEELSETDNVVLAAFQRYSNSTSSLEETTNYLKSMSDEQLGGVVANVKGILHEMEFVRIENTDGDSISAAMFPDTNHKGFDIVMSDEETGENWEIQLKTTNDSDYVEEWIEKYPDGEILVSKEIANELGIESSGLSNEELTIRVEEFVDQLVSGSSNSSLWGLIPTLSLLSIALSVIELHKRYSENKITYEEFKLMSMRITGIKIGKFTILVVALSIPGLNVVVGAALVSRLLYALISDGPIPPIVKVPDSLPKDIYNKSPS